MTAISSTKQSEDQPFIPIYRADGKSHHSPILQAFTDGLSIARSALYHDAPEIIRSGPVQVLGFISSMEEHRGSPHQVRDALIDVGAETVVETAIAHLAGGVPAAVAMGLGHVAERLKQTQPSWNQI